MHVIHYIVLFSYVKLNGISERINDKPTKGGGVFFGDFLIIKHHHVSGFMFGESTREDYCI